MYGLPDIFNDLATALIDSAANALRSHKGLRNTLLTVFLLGFIGAVVVAINPPLAGLHLSVRGAAVGVAIVLFFVLSVVLLAYTDLQLGGHQSQSVGRVLNDQLREIGQQRKVLEQRLDDLPSPEEGHSPDKKEELFDASLELNLNQLREYYIINKSQARSSFRMGVTAVLLGLIAILAGVGLLYVGGGQKNHLGIAVVTGVAGLLGQFIGGSCFYLFNKAQDQSLHFYDRLTELQGTLLAVQLAGSITKTDLADATRQQIVFALIKNSTAPASANRRPPRRRGAQGAAAAPAAAPNGAPTVPEAQGVPA